MRPEVQPHSVPPIPPGRSRGRFPWWLKAGGLVLALTLLLAVGFLWRSGRLLGGAAGRVAAIVRQVKAEEASNSSRLTRLRYSLPGPLEALMDRLFPQNWQGEYYYREELVKVGTNGIPAMIRVLETDRSLSARRVCAGALGDLNAREAIPTLTRLVRVDRDAGVRTLMAEVLGDFRDTNVAPVLVAVLEADAAPSVRGASARALGVLGTSWAAPAVIQALSIETNRNAKPGMMEALGAFADPRAVPILVQNLNAPEEKKGGQPERDFEDFSYSSSSYESYSTYELRVSAAEALGAVGGGEAVDALIARLVDEDNKRVRVAICDALGDARDVRALQGLFAQLEGEEEVKTSAIGALGKIGDALAVPKLLGVLEDPDEDIRELAVTALGRIGSVESSSRLRELLESDPDEQVRSAACMALALVGAADASRDVERVLPRLRDSLEQAIWALGHTGDSNAVPVLAGYLGDSETRNRFAAAYALAEIGGPEAAAALRSRLADAEDFSRHGKACALALLGDGGGLSTVREGIRTDNEWQRFGSALALLKVGGVEVSTELKPLLADRNQSLRTFGAGAVEGPTAALQALLLGGDAEFRQYAARAFAFFKDPAALPALDTACGDRDPEVREAARLSKLRIERDTAGRKP